MSQHTPYVLEDETSGTTGGTESKNIVRFRGAVSIFTMFLCLLLFITCILALCAIHTWPYVRLASPLLFSLCRLNRNTHTKKRFF